MRKTFIIISLLLCTWHLGAQGHPSMDPIETKIYFRLGDSDIDLSYKDNKNSLEYLVSEINNIGTNSDYVIKKIVVTGSASPEGNSDFNQRLSDKRTESLYRWVIGMFPEYRHIIKKESIGVDWEQLKQIVSKSYVPYKERVLDIIENTPIWIRRGGKIVDGRVKQLKDLDDGHVWRYMYKNFFAEMRMAGGGIICEVEYKHPEKYNENIVISSKRSLVVVDGDTTSYSNHDLFSVVPQDTIHLVYKDTIRISNDSEKFQQVIEETIEQDEADTQRKKREKRTRKERTPGVKKGNSFGMSIKTNMLYDLLLVPNIGMEFHLGSGWTLGANWMYAWWSNKPLHYYYRVYGGDFTLRKYFGGAHKRNAMTGHHLGLYGQMTTYDFSDGKVGQMAPKWSYGGGLEYGYSFPVAYRLNIDVSVGVGYFTGKYENYIPQDGHYIWQSTYMRKWIGPTKAEVSLVWLIGRDNYNQR